MSGTLFAISCPCLNTRINSWTLNVATDKNSLLAAAKRESGYQLNLSTEGIQIEHEELVSLRTLGSQHLFFCGGCGHTVFSIQVADNSSESVVGENHKPADTEIRKLLKKGSADSVLLLLSEQHLLYADEIIQAKTDENYSKVFRIVLKDPAKGATGPGAKSGDTKMVKERLDLFIYKYMATLVAESKGKIAQFQQQERERLKAIEKKTRSEEKQLLKLVNSLNQAAGESKKKLALEEKKEKEILHKRSDSSCVIVKEEPLHETAESPELERKSSFSDIFSIDEENEELNGIYALELSNSIKKRYRSLERRVGNPKPRDAYSEDISSGEEYVYKANIMYSTSLPVDIQKPGQFRRLYAPPVAIIHEQTKNAVDPEKFGQSLRLPVHWEEDEPAELIAETRDLEHILKQRDAEFLLGSKPRF